MPESLDVLLEKWDGVINNDKVAKIENDYKAKVTAQLLENTESFLTEATPTNVAGNMQNYDPILISLVLIISI
mgnify:CR=1 FL=1